MSKPDYSSLVNSQREYFLSGCTRSSSWRRAQLEAFKAMFTENHDEVCDALWKDLRRNVVDADLMDVTCNVNEANRWRHLLLVVLSGLLLNAGASQTAVTAQAASALTIKNIGPGVVAIDGDWQFHLGDDMHWIDPAYDDSQWEPIKADKTWGEQTHPGYAGFAWYRRHLDIAPPISGRQKLAILMPPVDSAYEIYWNGEKIGHQGVLPPGAVWYYSHRESFALASSLFGAERGLLAVRAWRAPPNSTGLDTAED